MSDRQPDPRYSDPRYQPDDRGPGPGRDGGRELSTADLAAAADRAANPQPMGPPPGAPLDREVPPDVPVGRADMAPHSEPLLAEGVVRDFQARWPEIQAGFVDEPRRAVERADSLVAEAIKRLAESFAQERASLEHQWDRGDQVSTEDLRQALQRYRAFFTRLLSL